MNSAGLPVSSGFAITLAGLVLAACGGTVVFEEDGGDGGGLAVTSTNVASSGSNNGQGGQGAGGPVTTIASAVSVSTGGTCGGLDEFQCFQTGECIDASWVCDGFVDCDDGTDEQGCSACGPTEFQCVQTGQCVPGSWVCDGFPDCGDGSDEQGCSRCEPGDFQCFDTGECIPGFWVCDDFVDCGDGSDEQNCGGCDFGFSTGDPGTDQCIGDFCCPEFTACSGAGQNVEACWECLQQGGGPLCDDAIACYVQSPCGGGGNTFICDSGVSTRDPQTDACLSAECCPEFMTCTSSGTNPQGCVSCFENGGGPLCDDAIACFLRSQCF